jgi:hypothetical protein
MLVIMCLLSIDFFGRNRQWLHVPFLLVVYFGRNLHIPYFTYS